MNRDRCPQCGSKSIKRTKDFNIICKCDSFTNIKTGETYKITNCPFLNSTKKPKTILRKKVS